MEVLSKLSTIDNKLLVAIIALSVGLFGSYLAYNSYRRNFVKKLSYKIVTESVLIGNLSTTVKDDIEILFKDYKVNNVYFIEITIFNSGFKAIDKNDFNEPISIKLNRESHILQYSVAKSNPKNLRIQISKNHSELLIEPVLLNSKDTFNIKMIVSDYRYLSPECRIKDIEFIKNETINPNTYPKTAQAFLDFKNLAYGIALGYMMINENNLIFVTFCAAIFLIGIVIQFIKEFQNYRKVNKL